MKGLDLSFAQPSQAWWNKRYTEGWRVLVQDAWTGVVQPTPTLVNLNRARTAGFITAAYVVVNNLPGATSVGWARQACGAEWDYLNFVAVDVEVPTTIKSIEEALFEVTRLGKKRCIYTSKNAWKVVNSTTRFSQEWLWNAYYDGDPDFDFFLNPYGGFAKLAGEQYQGTTNLDGYSVDLNNFSAAFIEQESDDMSLTAEQLANLISSEEFGYYIRTRPVLRERFGRAVADALAAAVDGHRLADPHGGGGVTIEQVRDEIDSATIHAAD